MLGLKLNHVSKRGHWLFYVNSEELSTCHTKMGQASSFQWMQISRHHDSYAFMTTEYSGRYDCCQNLHQKFSYVELLIKQTLFYGTIMHIMPWCLQFEYTPCHVFTYFFLHNVKVTNKPNVAGYAYCTIVVYVVSIRVTIIKKKSNQSIIAAENTKHREKQNRVNLGNFFLDWA